jgi:hypothetical protein
MNYLEWNNLIGQYFFNSKNAGKDVHLYITKGEIISLAKDFFPGQSSEAIWKDLILAIKRGIPGSTQLPIIDKAIYALGKSYPKTVRIEGTEILRPAYITYLVFFVLPLIEHQGAFTTSTYYARLREYLHLNGIDSNGIETLTFQKMDHLWSDLSTWANVVNNRDLGGFTVRPFTNKRWVYVGKPFSQCVFPPKAIKRLPELFLAADMIPDSVYQLEEIKRNLLDYGSTILSLPHNVIEIIRTSESNELGQSIIAITNKEYSNWTGESHTIDETGSVIKTKRNFIPARVYLQLQIFSNDGRIEFSYRMRSANEFPEDLNFNGIEISEEKSGYSGTLNLPFRETFLLKDDFNKWIAKFEDKDIRLFISAGTLQFSTDYWIETDSLSRANWMYLLCKNSLRERIFNWGKNHCAKFEDETDLENVPGGYALFRFLNPREGIAEIPLLTIITEKFVQLTSALGVDFRTFTNDFLPEVEILNSDGTEKVYLQYKGSDEKYYLKKKISINDRWLLPDDITLYSDFLIRVDNETLSGSEVAYKITSSSDSALLLDGQNLPRRDSFGRATDKNLTQYSIGSNTVGANLMRQIPYHQLFRGTKEDSNTGVTESLAYEHHQGNMLLSFLTLRGTTTAQDFYTAFELLHSKYFGSKNQSGNFNYTKVKKASLNFFDYLGYLDYEYETKSVVVNPPQLIFIPANKGRKVLLIGGRDSSLVKRIVQTAPKYHLKVEILRQFPSNENLLLPDAIIIRAFGDSKVGFGESNLTAFADELKIQFNPNELAQVSLQQFCGDIEEYEKDLFTNKETTLTYEDWATYIFNPDTLLLDKSYSENFDKKFALLEYKLRPWEFHHRLWANQKCYDVDKNWGKYVALKHHKKNVILYDRNKEKVAVPLELPLPRLLSESIMLLSGLAPYYSEINNKAYRVYENIPSIFIQNLFDKLKQRTIEYNL